MLNHDFGRHQRRRCWRGRQEPINTGRWQTFDARFNVPRIGRVKIACGLDAVDGAFSTLYGAADLVKFDVWAYQVDPREVDLGDPIDMAKRLCGTTEVRFPPRSA